MGGEGGREWRNVEMIWRERGDCGRLEIYRDWKILVDNLVSGNLKVSLSGKNGENRSGRSLKRGHFNIKKFGIEGAKN